MKKPDGYWNIFLVIAFPCISWYGYSWQSDWIAEFFSTLADSWPAMIYIIIFQRGGAEIFCYFRHHMYSFSCRQNAHYPPIIDCSVVCLKSVIFSAHTCIHVFLYHDHIVPYYIPPNSQYTYMALSISYWLIVIITGYESMFSIELVWIFVF